ncbi:MAG: acyl-CoA dehydrogenase family protein [Acidimicrobiales bacterium]
MDFVFTDEQQAVSEAAAAVFGGLATPDRVAQVERTAERVDTVLWAALAEANLLGIAVPESYGGSGLGLTELCLVLEQQGRHVAPVPLWATTVLGALAVSHFGSAATQDALLPGVVEGRVRMAAALTEVGATATGVPSVTATAASAGGWRLQGTAHAVAQAHVADALVVPAMSDEGVVLVVVDVADPAVECERVVTTDRQIHPHLHFAGVEVAPGAVLAGPGDGDAAVQWLLARARTGLCALALGVTEEAVRRAAAHCNERHQFGRPLSSFQGTLLRAADAYMDCEAIRVTAWQAAWRLDTGRPAAKEVAAAKWWASEAGQRVVHATQHLHGGLGADVEYPIHRYFLWGKQIELMLDGPSAQLASLGKVLAHERAEAVR